MLNTNDLLELNRGMLNLGAPVEIDGQGYNQVDWGNMYQFATATTLTDIEAYKMVTALHRYKSTQLTAYADQLTETLDELNKRVKTVQLLAYTATHAHLSWNFNQNVSNFIKSLDRADYRWTKPNGSWVLVMGWAVINPLLDTFEQNGFEVAHLRAIKAKLANGETPDGMTPQQTKPVDTSKVFKIHVSRSKSTVDTLEFKFDYNRDIVAVMGSIKNSYYINKNKAWHVYIDQAPEAYEALNLCKVKTDLTELEPWKQLVESWNKEWTMKPIPSTLPFTPYDFQIEDIKQFLKGKRLLNGNDMGCGKTFEDIMVGYSIDLPKLVICPPTLRLNWVKEIKMVQPDADITVLYDNSKYTTSEWTVVGYTSVVKHLKNLEQTNFQVILIDEAHYCQAINNSGDPDSQRAKAVSRLAATAGWVIPTTGTPKTNRNKNLYNILRMIRHPLTRGRYAWRDYGVTYCDGHQSQWGWDFEGNSNDMDLNELLKPYMIRHLKSEVLPDLVKVRRAIPVKVDLREYDLLIAEYLNNRKNKEAEQLARLMRARMVLATQKVGETISFAKEFVDNGDKVVLVTCFTEVANILENAFAGNCVKIVGGMSDTAKEAAKELFQTGAPQVMVLNIIAGGVGLTLTAAHDLIINDYDFVPGNIIQVEDRICRSGQTEVSNIYYITAQGADVEEDFVNMLTYKSDTINAAVDGGNGESIDFRSLVEKSAGRTRSNKVWKKMSSDDLPATPAVKQQKATQKGAAAASGKVINWKDYTTQELEKKAAELGATYTPNADPKINRMRIVMALKKVM